MCYECYDSVTAEQQERQHSQPSSNQGDTVDTTERHNVLLSIGFAAVAMTAYALFSGLIQIEITRTGDAGSEESAHDLSVFTFRDQEDNNESTAG